MVVTPSVNIHELSVRMETFRQLPSTFHAPGDLLAISVNFPFGRKTFFQLTSTFRTAQRPSINFHQLFVNFLNTSCHQKNFCEISVPPVDHLSTFCVAKRRFGKFCQLSVCQGDLLLTFRAASKPSIHFRQLFVPAGELTLTSVNFPCSWETYSHYCQLSMRVGDFLSSSVNFPCSLRTFH